MGAKIVDKGQSTARDIYELNQGGQKWVSGANLGELVQESCVTQYVTGRRRMLRLVGVLNSLHSNPEMQIDDRSIAV